MSIRDSGRAVGLSQEKQALLRRRLQGRAPGGASGIPRRQAARAALSPAQLGMWVKNQFLETNALYSVPRVLRIPGSLDVGALRRALDALVERHEILRTTYPGPPSPVQHVGAPGPASLRIVDLRHLSAERRWGEAMRLAQAEIGTPFDLARGPVFRALLITVGAEHGHVLVLTTHHIATDGWSCTLMLRELDELYRAMAAGREPDLAVLPIQYADYAFWQNRRVADDREKQLPYWRAALEATPRVLEIPTDRPRPATASYEGDCAERSLTPQLSARVRALATGHGVTVYTVLLASFATVLGHYCGQDRFALGSVLSGRNVAETEPLLGLFANVVALPMDLSGEPAFRELLRRSHAAVLGAFDHQDVTFDQVVSAVSADRAASRNPVYQVLFQCFEAAERIEELPGLGAAAVSLPVQMAKVDLTLNAFNGPASIDLSLNYATGLFTSATANRLLKYLVNVVEHVTAQPGTFVGSTEVMGPAEADLATRAWAGRRSDGPEAGPRASADSVVSLFRAQATAAPRATALICGEQELSYAELDQLTDRLATGLRAQGAAPGDVVGIALPRGIELVAAMLGVLKAGAAYLALDPGFPVPRLNLMLNDAGARLLLTDGNETGLTDGAAGAAKLLRVADLQGGDEPQAGSGLPVLMPGDLAYVVYTSGSSGTPHGVDITHEALANLLLGARDVLGAGPQDRWLALAPLSFDGLTMELFLPLVTGARVVVAPESARMDGAEQRRLIREHRVTHVRATPSGWLLLLAGHLDEQLAVAITTAETMPVPLAGEVQARSRRLVNAYGPTETTVHATYADVPEGASLLAIGKPIANVQVYLLNERLDPVPVGALGEICIGGLGLARGYHGRPGLTARRFVPSPFGPPGSRLYLTGDRARRLPDGEMDLRGRTDSQVKIRGYRVEPGEVEARMLAHPGVDQAAVVASAAPGGGLRLVGYFAAVPGRGAPPAAGPEPERELRSYLAGCLPGHLVPGRLVALSRMPLTLTGKIDRKALPAAESLPPGSDASAAPRSGVERTLARVWAAVLERDTIGRHDNFFDIGGDSLLAIYVVAGAREAGLAISPRQVLTQQTLAELASVAEPAAPGPSPGVEPTVPEPAEPGPDQVTDEYPLSPLQAGMVFHTLFEPESADYVIQLVYAVEGELDVTALRQAWEHVVARHPVLRTTFAWDGPGRPRQIVHRQAPVRLRELDWSAAPVPEVPDRLTSHLAGERLLGVNLECAPAWRLDLIRVADGSHRLIWHGHHVLLDGWSRQVVLDEVRTVYRSLRETGALPRLREPVPFRRYIDWLQSHDPAADTAYWQARLAGFPVPTPLAILPAEPGGRPRRSRTAATPHKGGRVVCEGTTGFPPQL
jgi:amino acid adenylation domain-containing protein